MNTEGKRLFGRLGKRWQLIKVGPNEMYECAGWIHKAKGLWSMEFLTVNYYSF